MSPPCTAWARSSPRALTAWGCRTLGDLLLLLPRGYEDRTVAVPLAQAPPAGQGCRVVVAVGPGDANRLGEVSERLKALVSDEARRRRSCVSAGHSCEPARGRERRSTSGGAFIFPRGELQCTDFELEPWSEHPAGFGSILPVYPLTEGLTQATMRKLMGRALAGRCRTLEPAPAGDSCARRGVPLPARGAAGRAFPAHARRPPRAAARPWPTRSFLFEVSVLRRKRALAAAPPRACRTLDTRLRGWPGRAASLHAHR